MGIVVLYMTRSSLGRVAVHLPIPLRPKTPRPLCRNGLGGIETNPVFETPGAKSRKYQSFQSTGAPPCLYRPITTPQT